MIDTTNQDTPVAWMWEDSTGCIYMCADRPDAVEMAASVSAEAVSLYSSDQINRMRVERDELRKALEFYANPEIYRPHPHGPAFDRRDLSSHARDALTKLQDTSHE